MNRFALAFLLVLVAMIVAPSRAAEVDFSHDVVPILKRHCAKCHAGNEKKGELSLNTRESLLDGGESAKGFVPGKASQSELISRIETDDDDLKMPPEGPRLLPAEVAVLRKWIDEGATWQEGFTFGKRSYEPPLKPRRPELPLVVDGRTNPIDRIIDAWQGQHQIARPKRLGDAAFARRAYLDIIGLLPTPEELAEFERDKRPDKRQLLVQSLLDRNMDYAEHWLTFWNDLLRNDYSGTGFITGGRKQISKWLYDALVTNKPYDDFARELIAPPTPESAGFGEGIRWRGEVSAGQTVEIQFAQSMAQSFLGINLKCASCHDSFIDRWTLEESYGLAAIYSTRTLDIHRCDQPTGKTASAAWLFPEIGQVDPKASQPQRLQQLAALMTHSENGRFTRTIVNRIWHRMMGRGIVHPLDAMQNEPWNVDLLDYLAAYLADNDYDLKRVIELIATSEAYQSESQVVESLAADSQSYQYTGPLSKRLTAEQFIDAAWQLTGAAPARYDAPVVRGEPSDAAKPSGLTAKWIWSSADPSQSPAGETIVFRKRFQVAKVPSQAVAVVSCDNSYVLYVNGQRVAAGENWEMPDGVPLTGRLKAGQNEILVVAKNGGSGPNLAGLFFEARLTSGEKEDAKLQQLATDASWQWTTQQPAANGRYKKEPDDWKDSAAVTASDVWSSRVGPSLASKLEGASQASDQMVRASLLKSDFLMRSLGRPNRDQIVSVRPETLTTLEAIDLSNGETLATTLAQGSRQLLAKNWKSPSEFSDWLFRYAVSRPPTEGERQVLAELLGDKLTEQGIEDALWAVIMLPEFQFVR